MKIVLLSALMAVGLGASLGSAMPTDTRARYESEDKELGILYNKLIAKLLQCKPTAVKRLRISERKWIEFRDAECGFEEQADPTGHYKVACLERLTLQRIETLKSVLEGVEAECQ